MSDFPAVDAADDRPHAAGPETDYSESFYYQFGDTEAGLNGFLRLSNRPNEGRGERTACLFLPDGRVALSFDKPTFSDPGVFDAGGLRILIEDALVHHRVSFAGEVFVLADGWEMRDPKKAFAEAVRQPCSIEFDVRAMAPAQRFELDTHGDFTPNHYEQFCGVVGAVRIGEEEFEVRGHGMRDRGWGPRSWGAPSYYRWTFGCTEGMGFAAGVLGRDGGARNGGFVWAGDDIQMLDGVEIRSTYDGDAVATVTLELIGADRSWSVTGEARNAVPLRHRRGDTVTRILETSVLWSHEGRRMLGIAEYLDQMVDGEPIGIAQHDLAVR